ncbi:sulfite exporter TauE/SafE family protein [Paraflavitalea soli]|uniref:Sulfite exporter TauE/SafE family protein n=1 Tax=Paraflavitalea soli TaxID=2315862 RepID=A0A3B7MM49_9BACT|nr:sulfite exporter TauE/SafE family protein [Paraflavitalea soli]AXY74026.1 sulfite exporter TauE/SafE family protein [Paraflavitalea soli]
MSWQVAIAGVGMGMVSSLHCIGMCGPLVMALPLPQEAGLRRLLPLFTYNTGRLTTYGLLGALFGLAGRRLQLAGWQQWLSVGLGVVILLGWFAARIGIRRSFYPAQIVQQQITQLNLYLWKRAGKAGFFLLGMANGLLPCGMVYLAVAAAISTGSTGWSTLFMVCFGLGTLPAMTGLGYFSAWFNQSVRLYLRKWIPAFTVAVGILLILRGLDLGIPYISPRLPVVPVSGISCH